MISRKLAELFKIFSDETRIKIISELFDSEKCVSEISTNLKLSQSLISHQLKILKDANLIDYKKNGKNIIYFLIDDHVKTIYEMGREHILEQRGGN